MSVDLGPGQLPDAPYTAGLAKFVALDQVYLKSIMAAGVFDRIQSD